jgi:hypothetical protein
MARHSRAGSSGPASKHQNRRVVPAPAPDSPKISHDIRETIFDPYLRSDVLDLSQASKFYQKEAAVAGALTDYVECLPGDRYRLKNGFDDFFRASLPVLLANHLPQLADALADFLLRLAQHWAEIKVRDSLPGDRTSLSMEALSAEWKQSWSHMQEKHWEAFRKMSSPLASYLVTAIDDAGVVDDRLCYDPTAHRIQLGVSFAQDSQRDPVMRILIKGDPAVRFMVAYIRKAQREPWPRTEKGELEKLRVAFESIMNRIAKDQLGLTNPSSGRPRELGGRAAYLLYHEGKPIRLVTRELCADRLTPGHICGSKCSDNLKKSATNYFKYLWRELESLMKSR